MEQQLISADLYSISFNELLMKANEYLTTQQEICKTQYKLSEYENWFYDQLTGELTFSTKGKIGLIIDYEKVGSVSEVTNTFLWAWDNPHTEEKVTSEIVKVRDYGLQRNFKKLINPKWEADQIDGWEMTAISSLLLKSKGAYRVPIEENNLFVYMIFKNITEVKA